MTALVNTETEIHVSSLVMEDEAPLNVLPDIPFASENYAWCGYDRTQNVGFFSHIGRWSQDPTKWREQLYVYLPDGSVLVARQIGKGDCRAGPEAATLATRCLTPGASWQLTFDGPVQRFRSADLLSGQPPEHYQRRLTMNLQFEGDTPVFFYPKAGSSSWGRWHYEQLGTIEGSFAIDGERYHMRGFAFRDHSRGPRNLSNYGGSNWVQGRFDDSSGFALFENWRGTGASAQPGCAEFVFIDASGIESATIVSTPHLKPLDEVVNGYEIVVDSPRRGRTAIKVAPKHAMMFSNSDRHEILFGAAPETERDIQGLVLEQPVVLTMNGLQGEGHSELGRSRAHAWTEHA